MLAKLLSVCGPSLSIRRVGRNQSLSYWVVVWIQWGNLLKTLEILPDTNRNSTDYPPQPQPSILSVASNLRQSSCLNLLSAGVTGMYHCVQLPFALWLFRKQEALGSCVDCVVAHFSWLWLSSLLPAYFLDNPMLVLMATEASASSLTLCMFYQDGERVWGCAAQW